MDKRKISNGVLEQYIKENGPWNKGKKLPQFSGEKSPFFKHGMSHTRFNTIWKHIINRCNNTKSIDYRNWGDRGIKCLWNSFEEFRDDMYESYQSHVKEFGEKDTTIDRIDNDGNYCKENCRWATKLEQGQNTRRVKLFTYNGETHSIREWAKIKGFVYETLWRRIQRKHWSIEKALNKPLMVNQFR